MQLTESVMTELPPDAGVYTSAQGDWWDTIAMKTYGMKRGNERLMYRLIEANYVLRRVSHFPVGVLVIIPKIEAVAEIPLVPWKTVTVTP
jgi:phage tail protein X